MMGEQPSRREFVFTTSSLVGGGWLWLQLPALSALSACARDAAQRNDPFITFTPAEGRAMRAFAARVIPSDADVPGAEEAGAAWFADRALSGPLAQMLPPVRAGLADLDERAGAAHGVVFAQARPEQQDAIIRAVVDTPFFFVGRMLVVLGTFSHPDHGGGRDDVALKVLRVEHAAAYQPPFGWYDAEHAKEGVA